MLIYVLLFLMKTFVFKPVLQKRFTFFHLLVFLTLLKRIKFQSLIPADHRGFKKVSRYFSILSPESSMFAFIDIELISKLSFDSTNIQGLNTYLTFQKVQ